VVQIAADRLRKDSYLQVLTIAFIAYVIITVFAAVHNYSNYGAAYYDVGLEAYSFYWHVHGLQYYTYPLDYVVFVNHVSPFSILIVPLFAIYQRPLTMFLVQSVFVGLTGILTYLAADDLLGSRKIGFAMAVAYFINAGTISLSLTNYHIEAIMPFFYMLSFYLYIKGRRWGFIASYALLLSLYEVMTIVGGSLLVALLLYELVYNARSKDNKGKWKSGLLTLLIALAVTAAFAAFYSQSAALISSSYANTPYSSIVPMQRIINYVSNELGLIHSQQTLQQRIFTVYGTAVGVILFFFGYGLSSLVNPVISLVLYSPWLFDLIFAHNIAFLYGVTQYYSYAMGGSIASAILGLMIIYKSKFRIMGHEVRSIRKHERAVAISIVAIASIVAVMFAPLFLDFKTSLPPTPQAVNTTMINQALATIPTNATVLAQTSIASHLYYIHELELAPSDRSYGVGFLGAQVYWTRPKYVVIDSNLPGYKELNSSGIKDEYNNTLLSGYDIYNLTAKNYTVIYGRDNLYIYRSG